MPNEALENQRAQAAYNAIATKYFNFFTLTTSVTEFSTAMRLGIGIENFVKFMDNDDFAKAFGFTSVALKRGLACRIAGFTSPKLTNKDDREIYINRLYAYPSTIIHEMLHFLTHPNFWNRVPPATSESVTEYFTRKVISKASGAEFNIDQRKDRYDKLHTYVALQRLASKAHRPFKGYMKAAYFEGDRTAIGFINDNSAYLEAMMWADD